MKVFVDNLLIANTDLMVHLLIHQLSQCLFRSNSAIFEILYCVDYIIIGYTTLYQVILFLQIASSSTIHNILKPLYIIFFKSFDTKI